MTASKAPDDLAEFLDLLGRTPTWVREVFSSRIPEPWWFDQPVCGAPLQALSDDLGGDLAFVEELLNTWVQSSPAPLRDLVQGLQQSDQTLARRGAHTLKGSSVNVGAYRVALLAAHLVELIGEGRYPDSLSLATLVRDEVARVPEDIPRVLSTLH